MSSKILEGVKQALAFAQGAGQAAHITTFVGGPYVQDGQRTLIQHKVDGGYIVWNWDMVQWDRVKEPIKILDKRPPLSPDFSGL